ncbi:MAG: ABC transporter permease subunit [Acidimicrobiales bacterium]
MWSLAQETEANPSWTANDWLNTFNFPFGEWIKQLVFWAVNNPITAKLGDMVEWPFDRFFDLILSDKVSRDSIESIPWIWVVIAVFMIGSFTRNTRVGLASAGMLAICGFLGAGYWMETARTIGMILVSVTLCAIVGIPVGVISGRVDSFWNIVRPTLDAMQVVHSFVFMLPFIFFFGIGEVSATMVTMVFALPPIVRLTNLGIRQVPEDVVEASRAFGATEARVLFDVQLPLARPAILTGLNQTLLLAISMLGIAALMGAGGLGRLLFRAINNLNLGLAASAGLAFFLVAVMFDRITQSEEQDGINLFKKIGLAWRYRADGEAFMEATTAATASEDADLEPAERDSPVEGRERFGLMVGAVASLVTIAATVFLTWSNDAGSVSSWGRRADEDLLGQSFGGLDAAGGSFFGLFVVIFAGLSLLACVRPLMSDRPSLVLKLQQLQGYCLAAVAGLIAVIWLLNMFNDEQFFFDLPTLGVLDSVWLGDGNDGKFGLLPELGLLIFAICIALLLVEMFVDGTPRLGADGAFIASLTSLIVAVGFVLLDQSVFVTEYSVGSGAMLALVGAAAMTLATGVATMSAPYSPRHPLPMARTVAAAKSSLVTYGAVVAFLATGLACIFNWLVEGDRIQGALDGSLSDGQANWLGGIITALVVVAGVFVLGRMVAGRVSASDDDTVDQVGMGIMVGGLIMLIGLSVVLVVTDNVFSGTNEFLLAELAFIAAVGGSLSGVTTSQIGASIVATGLIIASAFGVGTVETKTQYGWYFDGRIDSLITPEIQAEFDAIEEEAGDDIGKQLAAGQEITNRINSLQAGGGVVYTGVDEDGPGLGYLSIILSFMAILIAVAASGALGGGETLQWRATTVLAGLGLGIALIPLAFIFGIVRVDSSGGDVLGGIGAFVTFVSGFIIFASGRSVVAEFRRTKLYADYRGEGLVETVIGAGSAKEGELVETSS